MIMNDRSGIYRSRTDTVIGGVAGGIADALKIDAIIIRVIFVLLALYGGSGVLLYVILWIALPLQTDFSIPNTNPNPLILSAPFVFKPVIPNKACDGQQEVSQLRVRLGLGRN